MRSNIIEPPKPQPPRTMILLKIIALNLVPLYGVAFLGWDAKLLILTYFLETIITVAVHFFRLHFIRWRYGKRPETVLRQQELAAKNGSAIAPAVLPWLLLGMCGMFCGVQLFILGGFAERVFPEGIFTSLFQAAAGPLAWALAAFATVQLLDFLIEIVSEKYSGVPVEEAFWQPIPRIFVQQLTVILGAFGMLFGGGHAFLFVLIFVKMAADLFRFFIDNALLKAAIVRNDPEREAHFEEMKKMMKD